MRKGPPVYLCIKYLVYTIITMNIAAAVATTTTITITTTNKNNSILTINITVLTMITFEGSQ